MAKISTFATDSDKQKTEKLIHEIKFLVKKSSFKSFRNVEKQFQLSEKGWNALQTILTRTILTLNVILRLIGKELTIKNLEE